MIFQENIPIYVQIADEIKAQIISGKLGDGEKLQSIREYSITYKVTALTMQRAMALLESEHVIETKKGVGSFVKAGVQKELTVKLVDDLIYDFITRAANMGITGDDLIKKVKDGVHNVGSRTH